MCTFPCFYMLIKYIEYPLPQIKIAFLSDIHNNDIHAVVGLIKKEKVDYILIAGDVLERADQGKDPRIVEMTFKRRLAHIFHSLLKLLFSKGINTNDQNTFSLLADLSKIATVIISRGNHEWYYKESDLNFFKENNVILLDNDYLIKDGIVFGGLSSCYDETVLKSMEKENGYKILLCHHPEYYPIIQDYKIDLILSGHAHGGQIRLFNQGLYAPGQGLFPKYTLGIYGHMIVSNGMANTFKIPRINNEESFFIIKSKGE